LVGFRQFKCFSVHKVTTADACELPIH
jgi:hypothetical protein